ncbi:MAG: mechanosensitive ion channel domain-containing protein [Dongiaceae bacterium]
MLSRRADIRPGPGWGRFILIACLLLVAPLPRAAAQAPASQPSAVSEQDIDALVTTLQDPAAREKLIQQLQALKAAQAAEPHAIEPESIGAVILSSLSERVRQISDALVTTATAVLDLPRLISWTAAQLADPTVRARWLEVLLKISFILAAALAADWFVARLLRRPLHLLESRSVASFWMRIPIELARLLLELLPIAVFITVVYGVLPATKPSEVTRLVALTIINAYVATRVIGAVARAVFSPKAAELRLIPVSDETANYIVIWLRRLTVVAAYGYFLTEAALLLGLPLHVYDLLLRTVGLVVVAMLAILILQNRATVRGWLVGEGGTGVWSALRQRIAEVWHFLAIAYVFAIYVVWILDITGGFRFLFRATILTIVIIALARLVTTALRRLVARGFALSHELKLRFPGLETRVNRYLPFLEAVLHGAVYLFFALALLEVWGLHAFAWLTSDFGRRVFGSLVTIVVILFAAMVLSEIVNELIERYIRRRQGQWQDAERHARLQTLLPLLRNAFRVLLVVMVALIVLSELGLNIAPLLAGAGVAGLAIGFGAQTLVKDVITGIFILAEDTIAIGDVIDLDGRSGVVEAMTIRTIRLRDVAGAVHTIPFSSVATIKNMTKDFAYAVFDIGVSYREDIDRVMSVVREIGAGLQSDPLFQRSILEPIDVQGVNQLDESSVKIRARIKTRPMRQWDVAREFNRRLKQVFDEKGIEIPFPERTVHHRWEHAPPGASTLPVGQLATD